MQGFEPVTLSWKGESFTVPADKQMMLIAEIEEALAGPKGEAPLAVLFRKTGVPPTRLANALAAALRYAGAKVTPEEVYLSVQEDIANSTRDQIAQKQWATLVSILSIISPPMAAKITGKDPKKA